MNLKILIFYLAQNQLYIQKDNVKYLYLEHEKRLIIYIG